MRQKVCPQLSETGSHNKLKQTPHSKMDWGNPVTDDRDDAGLDMLDDEGGGSKLRRSRSKE